MSVDIRNIRDMNGLIAYFAETLNWRIDLDDFDDIEDIAYDFEAEDIGLKEEAFAKIKSLRQLPPLVDGQKWGIFCVEFDSRRFEVTALRKILSGLIPNKRNSADHAVWNQRDLLFLCFWGSDNSRTIGIAHFEERESGLPQIKMISCAPALEDFTQIKTFEDRLKSLKWPMNYVDQEKWQADWASAFTTGYRQTIQDSSTLTIQLASEAQGIRDRILQILEVESPNGYVHLLFEKFRNTLIHDMTENQFADMYAQTVVYGLFSARCMDPTQDDFSAAEAVNCIPNTNPFLKSLMKECLGAESNSRLSFDELEIGNVVELLMHTKTDAIIADFNRQTGGGREDPVIHFYEEFLTAYDKLQKVQRGVYYTPQPVVSFIVRAVDTIIKRDFGLEDGLASTATKKIKVKRRSERRIDGYYREVEDTMEVPAIQVLDPATGTGTFIRQTILQIYENFKEKNKGLSPDAVKKAWNEYVPKHLLPRINAFELMMAPYAVAHMKLAMVLRDTGYDFESDQRLNVYLTNSLEEPGNSDGQLTFWSDPLATESIAANAVKKNNGINIIIGNPPYSGESANKGDWILSLMEDYKYEPGTRNKLNEANSKFVNDDYIKFIRYSQNTLSSAGEGILCFICPHGYIDSPTFRGVRYSMMECFQEIYILDLHGNSKKKEKAPDGSKDENVFDIQQGVCICLFLKQKNSSHHCRVFHSDLYGTRDLKYSFLSQTGFRDISWREVPLVGQNYFFNYQKNTIEEEYNAGFPIRDLFPLGTLGVLSKRDSLVVGFTQAELEKKISLFLDSTHSTEEICNSFNIPEKDNDKWNADLVRQTLRNKGDYRKKFIYEHYRPFDIRMLFYDTDIIARPNVKVLQHMTDHRNLALILCRQGGASNLDRWDCVFVVNMISDQNIFRRGGGTVLPLYLYKEKFGASTRVPNLDSGILRRIYQSLNSNGATEKTELSPKELLAYIYAILHSEKYRTKYKEYLSKEFPRVPYPTNATQYTQFVGLGMALIEAHTQFMEMETSDKHSFIGSGNCSIDRTLWKDNKIYINKSQYFDAVSKDVFDYTIGGNSPLQKWLKDRKGRTITDEDISVFNRIIVVLEKTLSIIKQIDSLIAD